MRWLVVFVFILSSALSFYDRQLLSALNVTIRTEFQLSGEQFGYLLSVFSIVYALSAPVAGNLIDRYGLNRGTSAAVALWSMAALATGFTGGLWSLLACRAWLGLAESANIPSTGKAYGLYLKPGERAMGAALGQLGISIGIMAAPIAQSIITPLYGWRAAFLLSGVLGFLWIPLWLWMSPKAERNQMPPASKQPLADLLRDRRFWGLILGNMLGMTVYSLWIGWTTAFLVQTYHMSQESANSGLAWIPAVFASLGGIAGGALSLKLAKASVVEARLRCVLIGAVAMLATAAAPLLPNPSLATAFVCWSFFWSLVMSVNVYALPIDYFGPERAATGVAALTFGYGLMQTIVSPVIGRVSDGYGFGPVCAVVAVMPLAAYAVLRITGADPKAVVASFATGPPELVRGMLEEVKTLIPDRRHFVVAETESYWDLRRRFRGVRIGMVPLLIGSPRQYRAFLLAPTKILAYNSRLERHHLKLSEPLASWLFWRGVPLDRIWLRPWGLFTKDKTVVPDTHRIVEGRQESELRAKASVLSPYFPWPLSHGGAVRLYHLLREAAIEFDVTLFAFVENETDADFEKLRSVCTRLVLVPKPRYREPRWSSVAPPEVCEYRSPGMERLWRERAGGVRQVEFTQLGTYEGEILVEHDITFDLYRQSVEKCRNLANWWNWRRWVRFERRALERAKAVVVMSEKDAGLSAHPKAVVIENGVDLDRFVPVPERPGQRLLFIGSFRHFPNVEAFCFFTEQVWPALAREFPEMTVTVVAGPDPLLYWRDRKLPEIERVRFLGFVSEVRPLYEEANLVLVPTVVSAGTNLKVLEAMAMERAVVSTTSGCAGLGLVHGESVWVADGAEAFREAVRRLIGDAGLRERLARAARRHAERYSWRELGRKQRALWKEFASFPLKIHPGASEGRIVAGHGGREIGFALTRQNGPAEWELLDLVVEPAWRRKGVAAQLLAAALEQVHGEMFLEVRESNLAARRLYERFGFVAAGRRREYYGDPPEDGIVMRLRT